jgi:hypothetical protein
MSSPVVHDVAAALKKISEAVMSKVQTLKITKTVTLCAVSKTKPASMLKEAYDAGQRHFGENYVNEVSVFCSIILRQFACLDLIS